jgi:hypothetical protein
MFARAEKPRHARSRSTGMWLKRRKRRAEIERMLALVALYSAARD